MRLNTNFSCQIIYFNICTRKN